MKNNRFKKNELTKKIFLGILGAAAFGVFISAAVMAPNCVQLLKLFDIDKRKKKNIKRTVAKLKKQRLIRVYFKGDKQVVELTEKGKKRILKYNFEEIKIKITNKWDDIWRIIIFDIPHEKKKIRDALRMKLNEIGFLQLQKSVFVFPFPCRDELDFIIEFFRVRKFVSYIEAKYIEGEENLKRIFDIS